MSGYPRPKVYRVGACWLVTVTRGFSGNYEHDHRPFASWREAFDWAYSEVKDWNPEIRVGYR